MDRSVQSGLTGKEDNGISKVVQILSPANALEEMVTDEKLVSNVPVTSLTSKSTLKEVIEVTLWAKALKANLSAMVTFVLSTHSPRLKTPMRVIELEVKDPAVKIDILSEAVPSLTSTML